jgi:hypothetical protein
MRSKDMKRTEKPLTQDELKRYERALILWEQGLKKETAELDEREEELVAREAEVGIFYVPEPVSGAGNITLESMQAMYHQLTPKSRKSVVFNDDGCTITPEEFVTTIPACGQKCYEGGEHTADCARMIYLEVERLGSL